MAESKLQGRRGSGPRVLFMAPRFHTNLLPFLQGLVKASVSLKMIVVGQGATEEHDDIPLEQLKMARFQPFLALGQRNKSDFSRFAIRVVPDVFQLYRLLKDFSPDYVVVRGLTPIYILCSLPYIILGSRLVLYTQGARCRTWSLSRWLINTCLLLLSNSRWYTPVDRRGGDQAGLWCDDRIHWIPFAMSVCPEAERRSWNTGSPRMLVIGKYERRKNHHLLIGLLSRLPVSVCLTIVGELTTSDHQDYFDSLVALASDLGVANRVTFLVNRPHCEMKDLYLSHDLFVMASEREPASVSQLEAMAHGLGVIIARDNGTAHYVEDKVNGATCDSTESSIFAAISMALDSPENLSRWGTNSLGLISERHAPAVIVDKFMKCLRHE